MQNETTLTVEGEITRDELKHRVQISIGPLPGPGPWPNTGCDTMGTDMCRDNPVLFELDGVRYKLTISRVTPG